MLTAILALALVTIAPERYTFEPEGKGFRVEMPRRPDRITDRAVTNRSGTARLTSTRVRVSGALYLVEATENRGRVDPETLDEGIRRFAANRRATLGAVVPISVAENPGRDFEMTEPGSEGPRRSKRRWVTSGKKLLMLAVVSAPGAQLPRDADQFLGSLEIGNSVPPAPVAQTRPATREFGSTALTEPALEEAEVVMNETAPDAGAENETKPGPARTEKTAPHQPVKLTLKAAPRDSRAYAAGELSDLGRSFAADRDAFRDAGPAGSVLVGVRVTYIERFGGPKVRSAQPIFRSGNQHYLGQVHGAVVGPIRTFLARPGYAVGGVVTHTGLTVDGFGLVFMKVDGDHLDTSNSYNSPWIGDENGGNPGEAMGKGQLVVGITGRAGRELFGLGLIGLTTSTAGGRAELAAAQADKPAAAPEVPLAALPEGARPYDPAELTDLGRSFASSRDAFHDAGPADSVLVGVRVTYIEHFGGSKVRSAQPIFRSGNQHYLGQAHGEVVGPITTAVARPGYAVGGLVTHTGLTVDGFRMVFMKIDGDHLDPGDSYNSPWIGDEKGGGPAEVMSKGQRVVGFQGRAGRELFALSLIARR